ncbi:MAG: radical SAM protein [Deltaproteobacteria bacterium]|nr:radical SAM protein [Deltaproteobacteria bacterium]MBW1873434.1 radical SAM protein [Deltaproteobacteria bacterium]
MNEGGKRKAGGRLEVAVIYPGPRNQGLASLAVHSLYRQISNQPSVNCERIFIEGGQSRPVSIESGRPAAAFDFLAVTASFEEQWVLLPYLLSRSGIPPRWRQRHAAHPIVAVGGFAVRLNPGPVLPFADLVVPSEAETVLPSILETLSQGHGQQRQELYQALGAIEGVAVHPDSTARIPACLFTGTTPVAQVGVSDDSVFSNMFLVETGRGCPVGCRFCAVGYSRRPPVFFGVDEIVAAAEEGINCGLRIGLVGASLARHPDLVELVERFAREGADLSPASLDANVLSSSSGETLLRQLSRSGQRTITLAVESGSQRIRRMINKPLTLDMLECAVTRLGQAGILNLKLYLMYGMPTETDQDLEQTVELVTRVQKWLLSAQKQYGRAGRLTISANPFVPKPHTPLGREAMPTVSKLKKMRNFLERNISKIGGVAFSGFSPRLAVLQCLLDRSGEEVAQLLELAQGEWPPPGALIKEQVPNLNEIVHADWPMDRPSSWDMIDVGFSPATEKSEHEKALLGETTPICSPDRCDQCGACQAGTIQ